MRKVKFLLRVLTCLLFAFVLAFACAFAGCTEYKPPEEDDDTIVDDDDTKNDNTDETYTGFSVQLVLVTGSNSDGNVTKNFTQATYESAVTNTVGAINWGDIQVRWTDVDTGEIYLGYPDKNGKAVPEIELDGDYTVTLTQTPTNFAYDPNAYTATNDEKNIEVTMYSIIRTSTDKTVYEGGDHSKSYTCHTVTSIGAYEVTLYGPSSMMGEELNGVKLVQDNTNALYGFKPTAQGTYRITTLVNVTDDLVSPIITKMTGSIAAGAVYASSEVYEGGGASGTFTKNVSFTFNVPQSYVGNTYLYQISSKTIDALNGYPVTFCFIIEREGDGTAKYASATHVEVPENIPQAEDESGTWKWSAATATLDQTDVFLNSAENIEDVLSNGVKIDGTTVKPASVELGENAAENDGYYYYFTYDEDTKTLTLSKRLYMALTATALQGNSATYETITTSGDISVKYLTTDSGKTAYNYTEYLAAYREKCNGNGMYPVTEDLKEFAQMFALANLYFNDGNGWAETAAGFSSDEDSMWMFICGYYA